MKQKISMLRLLGLLAVTAACLSACNTAEGFGQDMEQAGRQIQGAVKK